MKIEAIKPENVQKVIEFPVLMESPNGRIYFMIDRYTGLILKEGNLPKDHESEFGKISKDVRFSEDSVMPKGTIIRIEQ